MPQHVNKTHCIVAKLVLSIKERILLMKYEQAGKEQGHQNSFRLDRTWPTFHFTNLVCLMWTSSETLIFTEKTYSSKNNPTCENAVARTWELDAPGDGLLAEQRKNARTTDIL